MTRHRIGLALAAILALSATAVNAQSVAQTSDINDAVKNFHGSPDSLTTMISRIERTTGGRVLEIRFTDQDGMPGFRAAVARGGEVSFIRVAAEQGDAVELSQTDLPDWMLHWRSRQDVKIARAAKVSLIDAIHTAEQSGNGAPAVAAGIAASASNPSGDVKAYNVLLLRGGEIQRVAVDEGNGEVIADPRALASWP